MCSQSKELSNKIICICFIFIQVRANSQNSKTYSDSDGVVIKTYPEPNNITLLHATPYALNISWIPSKNVSIVRLVWQSSFNY